jgi:hypothetical protein
VKQRLFITWTEVLAMQMNNKKVVYAACANSRRRFVVLDAFVNWGWLKSTVYFEISGGEIV